MSDGEPLLEEEPVDDLGFKVVETVYIYGSIFLGAFIIFNLIRNRFPRLYNRRAYNPDTKCEITERPWNPFKWVISALKTPDEEFLRNAGVDGVMLVRINMIGLKTALFGMLMAAVLIPVYRTAPLRRGNRTIADEMSRWSMGHCYNNDPRMWVSVVGLYFMSAVFCYLVYFEFEYFYKIRHAYFAKFEPANYTIYVNNLPAELRSNYALRKFFTGLFGDNVQSTTCSLEIKDLEELHVKREKILLKLEHAQNVLSITGERPTHSNSLCGGEKHDTIDAYHAELDQVNNEISEKITAVEAIHSDYENRAQHGMTTLEDAKHTRTGGFITFKSIVAAQFAQQVLHKQRPYYMVAEAAPHHKDLVWNNVGLNHVRITIGSLLALALTGALCIFWTIPIGFLAALSKVDSIKETLPFLRDAAEAAPILDSLLAQLSPLALIVAVALLPPILYQFSRLEGHVSEAVLQASVFSKLAYFKLIQVFYVSALGGAIISKLQELVENPGGAILGALGNNLPGMASYFMTYLMVQCFLQASIELIQIGPAVLAFIRRKLRKDVTEKERNEIVMGLRPLGAPLLLQMPAVLSNWVIIFTVTVVYSVLHPIVSLIMCALWFIWGITYRNQIGRIYSPENDTGGEYWPRMAQCLLISLLIAQVTIIAVMGIKEAPAQTIVCVPLLIITILFFNYMQQQHFRVAKYLPSDIAMQADSERDPDHVSASLPRGMYVQQALKHKVKTLGSDDMSGQSTNGMPLSYVGYNINVPTPTSSMQDDKKKKDKKGKNKKDKKGKNKKDMDNESDDDSRRGGRGWGPMHGMHGPMPPVPPMFRGGGDPFSPFSLGPGSPMSYSNGAYSNGYSGPFAVPPMPPMMGQQSPMPMIQSMQPMANPSAAQQTSWMQPGMMPPRL